MTIMDMYNNYLLILFLFINFLNNLPLVLMDAALPSSSPISEVSYPDSTKKYQSASLLVRPLWMDPKKTWKAFQLHSSRAEQKKRDEKTLTKEWKMKKGERLIQRITKASIISKRLFLLLSDISNNLQTD